MTEFNKAQVRRLTAKNETANGAATILATRERAKAFTDLRRLKQEMQQEGFKVVPEEFTEYFQDMAKAGIGQLVVKAGQPPRFKWNYNLIEVSKAAVDNTSSETHHAASKDVIVVLPSGAMIEVNKADLRALQNVLNGKFNR